MLGETFKIQREHLTRSIDSLLSWDELAIVSYLTSRTRWISSPAKLISILSNLFLHEFSMTWLWLYLMNSNYSSVLGFWLKLNWQSKIIYHCKVIDNFKCILRGYSNKCIVFVRLKDWKRNLVNKFSIFIYLCNC